MPDFTARVAGTQQEMKNQGVDLLFLRPSPDLTYLTGFRMVPFSSAMMYSEMWLPESWLFGAWVFQEGDPIITIPVRFHKAIGEFLPALEARVSHDASEAAQMVRALLTETGRSIRNIGMAKVSSCPRRSSKRVITCRSIWGWCTKGIARALGAR
jgi:Xaa-Pro aminopeptidase